MPKNANFSPLFGPYSALRAARYAGRAMRAGVLRTTREADTILWSDPTYETHQSPFAWRSMVLLLLLPVYTTATEKTDNCTR